MPFRLLDLPTELIDLIVEYVYLEGGRLVRAINALSFTCKALRSAAKPLLFATVTIETNAYYLNTDRAPRWVNDDKAFSLAQVLPYIRDSIGSLKFVSWRRRTHATYVTDSWKFPEDLNMSGTMPRLRTIVFDPPHACTRSLLRILNHGNLHVIFEYRNHDSPSPITMFEAGEHLNTTWSIACGTGHEGAIEACRNATGRLKALQWAHPTNRLTRDSHIKLLDDLRSSPLLEELHVSERILDLDEHFARNISFATQICNLVSTLPHLKRIRIEGNDLAKEFSLILPSLVTLEDLSIYSVYRRVFHETCDLEDATNPNPHLTVDMPWLKLPRLRKLDLRFVCKHFGIEQLIPPGLTALRAEFYGAEERMTPEDMDWLVQYCPHLEQLELDMGLMEASNFQATVPETSTATSSRFRAMIGKLKGFRRLKTLRLFPSYWFNGKLLSHPFIGSTENVTSAVRVFRLIRSICPSIHNLTISISFGEYPFDVVPRMSLDTRPMKFVLRSVGEQDDVLVHAGYGANTELLELVYRGETALLDVKVIPTLPKDFFDDLSDGWILPHYELDR